MSVSRSNTPPILLPPRLRPGDRIGVISPAGPIDASDLKPDINLLTSRGYQVREAPHLYDQHDYLAGDDEARLSDLHAMFEDSEIAAIFCARGGYGSLRLLHRIDYHLIQNHPKIVVGYSDITALLMAIYQKTGLITFHGPMVRGLSTLLGESIEGLFKILSSGHPVSFDPMEARPLVPGQAEGSLLGGNLSLVCHLVGTPFLPTLEGSLLFVEDRGEPLYRIDRMLTHLTLAGHLSGIAGLIGGEFVDCGDTSAIDRLLLTVASDLNIPLLTGFPLGHGHRNLALPLGVSAQLDTHHITLRTLNPCVV